MDSYHDPELNTIKAYLTTQEIYDRQYILKIMTDPDLNRPALLAIMMTRSEIFKKVNACFSFDEIADFHYVFAKNCIIQNPDGETAPSRYIAAHDLVHWIKWMKHIKEGNMDRFVSWLEKFYREYNQNDTIRSCIINGIMEHLFEDVDVKSRFQYWIEDPTLSEAYNRAEEWIK